MSKHPHRYEYLAQPSPDGHRFFRGFAPDEHLGSIYIADQSGATPASTDDGPLRFGGDVWLGLHGPNRVQVVLSVSTPEGKRSDVFVSLADLQWLAEQDLIVSLRVAPALEPLARVFARIPWEVAE